MNSRWNKEPSWAKNDVAGGTTFSRGQLFSQEWFTMKCFGRAAAVNPRSNFQTHLAPKIVLALFSGCAARTKIKIDSKWLRGQIEMKVKIILRDQDTASDGLEKSFFELK